MGRPVVDLTGQRFGMLTVERLWPEDKVSKSGRKEKQWYCSCECGGHRLITGNYLKLGYTKSCGCTNQQEDYTGKVFCKLTVLHKIPSKEKKYYYSCRCECGNEVKVNHYDLRDGKRTSCGKCEKKKRPNEVKNLVGLKVGKLTVLDEEPIRRVTPSGGVTLFWNCLRECGRTTYVSTGNLVSRKIKSCGCLLAKRNGMTIEKYEETYKNRRNKTGALDLTGQRFGRLIALERISEKGKKTKWKCLCDCGNITYVQTSNLTNGHTQSCGCINSVGEVLVAQLLKKHNVEFKRFYRDQRCVDERTLPFDFAVMREDEVIGLIEYDGEQHFRVVRFNGMTQERAEQAFKEGLIHDQIKNEFCEKYNIPLLRIKYDQRDNLDALVEGFLNDISYRQSV